MPIGRRSARAAAAACRATKSTILIGVLCAGVLVGNASAQLVRVGSPRLVDAGDTVIGGDAAYDPVNRTYLIAMAREGAGTLGSVWGAFVDISGNPLAPPFPIRSAGRANFARAAYSPHVSNGAGGVGGFLVTWTEPFVPGVFSQIVAYPNRVVGTAHLLSPQYSLREVAYSPASQRFLVAWETSDAPNSALVGVVGIDAQAVGLPVVLANGNAGRPWIIWNSITSAAWHDTRNEFGVLYAAQSATAWALRFARVSAAGVVADNRHVIDLGAEPIAAALGFSPLTGNYVALWADPAGAITGAELSGTGAVISVGPIPQTILGGQNGMALAYSGGSGTFLLLGFSTAGVLVEQVKGMELNKHGAPSSPVTDVTDFPLTTNYFAPRAAGRPDAPEWLVTAGATIRYAQIVSTSTLHGGTDLRLGGCDTPDPFLALGGGACYAGGWLAPGMPIPGTTAAPPLPSSSPSDDSCATPDPFVALGGGTCYNGDWLPPGMPIPGSETTTPPPPPPPPPGAGGCATPDPFVALGGGTCYNGGWLPPGMPIPGSETTTPPPPPTSDGCPTPDPFVALGGGQCVDGGWLPPGMYFPGDGIIGPNPDPAFPPPPQSTNDCTTPDPYLATEGAIGVCVNGTWQQVAGAHANGTVFIIDGIWLLRENDTGWLYTPLNGMPASFHAAGLPVYFEGMLRYDILHTFPAPILQLRVLVTQ